MTKAETVNKEPLEKQPLKAADKLHKYIDADEYKHVVLGLIFLKYIFDSLEEHFSINLEPERSTEFDCEYRVWRFRRCISFCFFD